MFYDILPYFLGIVLTAAIVLLGYEIWARVTGKLYTPRHARNTRKQLTKDGEHLIMKIVEHHDKEVAGPPPVLIESLTDIQAMGRVRGAVYVRIRDIVSGKIDPEFMIDMIFSRARASNIRITVEAYEELETHRFLVRWYPEKQSGNTKPN